MTDDEEPAGGAPEAEARTAVAPDAPRESGAATAALILGVAGLVTIPVVVSVAAIVVARRALEEIAADPGLGGAQRARAGRLLGWIGIAIFVVVVVVGVVAGIAD